MSKTVHTTLRLSQEAREYVERLAEQNGLSVTKVVEMIIRGKMRGDPKVTEELRLLDREGYQK